MTSHDLPIEEIRKLLEADRNKGHVHVFDHAYRTGKDKDYWRYCLCGKWESE